MPPEVVTAPAPAKMGRPATGRTGVTVAFYLPLPYRDFIDLWEGETPSQRLINALDDLERFRPNGPTVPKARGGRGRFLPHEPVLLARAVRGTP